MRFLEAQHVERDGVENAFFAGCWGIFGHGNVAGVGQALLEREVADEPSHLRYLQGRNEQAMVHAAVAYARQRDRLATMAVTASVGPGATNMVTGAALATINRLPVLLLPGDTFATKVANPVLQELEDPANGDISVNDAFRPVSAYFDRVHRPEQLAPALLNAMRVLTDPAATGAVTLALPQDVQAEAWDWPEELFARRVWHVARPVPEPAALERAVAAIRDARKPLDRRRRRRDLQPRQRRAAGVRRGDGHTGRRDAGRQGCAGLRPPAVRRRDRRHRHDGRQRPRRRGGPRDRRRYALQRLHDRLAHGVRRGRRAVRQPQRVRVRLAQARRDQPRGGRARGPARTRCGARRLDCRRRPHRTGDRSSRGSGTRSSRPRTTRTIAPLPAQSQVIGAVNELSDPRDVVLCAAGSMPGDLHKLWRTRDRKGYHVEYGFSCMGYEIAGGLGVKLAALDEHDQRDVFVMVGDGSYLMMNTELVTAVAEGVKIIVVLVQNHGFASIGALSESLGSQRFGTQYRYRTETGLDGDRLPVDLAANAASLGADVLTATGIEDFRTAVLKAKQSTRTTVIHVETDPLAPAPDSPAWWDVPVAEVSALDSTQQARTAYEEHKTHQRTHLAPSDGEDSA